MDQTLEENTLNQSQPNRTVRRWDWLVPVLLIAILLLGAAYRLIGVEWDSHTHLHPDERFLTMVESALDIPGLDVKGNPPQGCTKWGGYFNTACSPLNPYNHDFGLFVYGTFPMFLVRVAGQMLEQTGYDQIYLVGRVLSALFDLSTVLFIFFIGKRLYGARVGLLSALFLAAAVLDIQQSHFFTVDTFTNVPIVIAFWYALDIADGKKWTSFIGAGIAFGFALAGRINIALFAVVLIAAAALRAYRAAKKAADDEAQVTGGKRQATLDAPESLDTERQAEESESTSAVSGRWSAVNFEDQLMRYGTRAFWGLVGCAVAALIVFRIFQPYAANGPNFISPTLPKLDLSKGIVNVGFDVALSWAGGVNPKFADNMAYANETAAGKIDMPPGHQWANRPAYIFPLENMVQWGLGTPLGLAAWAGFLFALYQLLRYRKWQHLLIVVWVGVTFGYTGQLFVKTMRYFLQIYPFMALLGGWFLVELWDKAKSYSWLSVVSGRFAKIIVAAIVVIVIGYTLFWATAFTSIYTRPYTRVAASRWIIKNVPLNSVIANEHWDDPLPVPIDGLNPFGGMFRGLSSSNDGEMHWYDEDTPEKRVQAIQWLDEADYIVLSSNRLYGSIARLPMRYPMTTQYYDWLFSGKLGFEKVADFTSRPQLFGIEIKDDNADEAFTVYDHDHVQIFKKASVYSHDNTEKLFNSVDLSEVYRFDPRTATQAKTALLLTPSDWAAQLSGGTWSQIFNPDDFINRIPVIVWLLLLEILGWITFPIAFVVFRGLSDRGYVFAKALGILFPAWIVWMLASFHVLPFSRGSIALGIVVVALVSIVALWRRGRDLLVFMRSQRTTLLIEEALFLVAFFAFLLIRYGNPDLWHPYFGGEKPMDFALLNAIIKSTWFPPYDPWFAGGYINYYYFGQYLTATLVKFTGIVPEVAYNLALPMFFALLATGAFSVVYNLVAHRVVARSTLSGATYFVAESKGSDEAISNSDVEIASQRTLAMTDNRPALFAGFLGAVFVVAIGNLGQIVLLGQALLKVGGGNPGDSPLTMLSSIFTGLVRVLIQHQSMDIPTHWWYWNASRVIPNTINEFPFFSFTYADLHAHVMALPFTLVVMGFAVSYIRRERDDNARLPFWPYWQISPMDVIEVVAIALAYGALRAINFADYFPTYLGVIGGALAIGEYGRRRRIDWDGIVAVAWRLIAIYGLSTVLYQPFASNFATAYLESEIWKGDRTELGQYLVVHGIFLFVITTFLVVRVVDTTARRSNLVVWTPLFVVGLVVMEALFLFANLQAFAIAFPLLLLAAILVLTPDLDAPQRFITLLIAAGLALTMMVELVAYKGDIGRMNTVFKFYLQVWMFFAISAAAGVAFLMQPTTDHRLLTADEDADVTSSPSSAVSGLSMVWWTALAILIGAGLLYPITAAYAKVNDRFVAGAPSTLNGMDYMQDAVYNDQGHDLPLVYDRDAIDWMRKNILGSPVMLEGNAPGLYQWGSRVSIYTGLPTIIGWDWHQKQQRSIIDSGIIDRRIETVRQIFNTRDVNSVIATLKRLHVSYVYIGDLERAFYDAVGLAKFDALAQAGSLKIVYQNDRVKIFQVQ